MRAARISVGRASDERKCETKVATATLASYAGANNAGPFGTLHVYAEGDELLTELPGGGGRQPLFAQSQTDVVFPAIGAKRG